MNRCSKFSRCVYFASVVKPKTCRALGIAAVGFVGDHLKDKKLTIQHIGLTFI